MKIVHIIINFLEGFSYQENELAAMHSSLGHEVFVIASKDVGQVFGFTSNLANSNQELQFDYRIIKLKVNTRINHRLWRLKGLNATLQDIKPDLIFFHGGIPIRTLFDIVRYKKLNPTVKIVMDFHSDYLNSAKGFVSREIMHKRVYRTAYNLCDKYISKYYYITPETRQFILKVYNIEEHKMDFLPLGGNLETMKIERRDELRQIVRRELGIKEGDLVIISGGKLNPLKQTHKLCDAFNMIERSDIHMILFGSIDKDYKETLLKSIAGNKNIHTIGWLSSSDMYAYFHSADLACFPSSRSVLWQQSICCGLPLIVPCKKYDVSYLNVNDNVLFIEDDTAEGLLAVLLPLLSNKKLLNTMAYNASTVGREFFSYKRIAQKIISDLDSI